MRCFFMTGILMRIFSLAVAQRRSNVRESGHSMKKSDGPSLLREEELVPAREIRRVKAVPYIARIWRPRSDC